jgi:hypothetical protein
MKNRFLIIGVTAAGCLLLPRPALAQVSTDDFNALKKSVEQLDDKVQKLEQSHEQDQKTHEADQQQIQQLEQKLGETQTAATNAAQKADAVAAVQSTYPVVSASPNATHNFTMVGDAEVQFGKTAGQYSTFALADFAPIFLFRASDDFLFEAGFDIGLNNNFNPDGTRAAGHSTSVDLSFGQMDYLLNDYVTVVAGDMLLPLGTYSERGAGWLNKIPDDPLVRQVLPDSGVGVQLRGALPIGQSGQMITYAAYGVNGPSSADGTDNSTALDLDGNVGDTPNWHSNPSGGGRIGWFYPWMPHYDIELGISGQSGEWDDAGTKLWSAAVVDAAVHVGPNVELKGEYINTWVETGDMGTLQPRGWWGQAGYKLAGLGLEMPYINNVELVGRYDRMADDGMFGGGPGNTTTQRYTFGYVYYLSSSLWFEGDYEILQSRGALTVPPNAFVFQLSYGF